MLTYNVTGLLRSTPGTVRTYQVVAETIAIADDLRLARPIEGEIRLTRTGRSILARGELDAALDEHCSRCLRPTVSVVHVAFEEEALPSIDFLTGLPVDMSEEPDALRLDEHHELDLEPTVREAISLAEPIAPLHRPDCPGLCEVCGVDLNDEPAHRHEEMEIDPRLARLAEWAEPSEAR